MRYENLGIQVVLPPTPTQFFDSMSMNSSDPINSFLSKFHNHELSRMRSIFSVRIGFVAP